MKKITTLLCLLLTIFTGTAIAQQLCDARFTFQVAGYSVQFASANLTTTALYQHRWTFGDGTASSGNNATPLHQYAAPGTYYVNHIVTYRSPNDSNTVACSDTVGATVVISGNNPCNLNAYITFFRDSVQTNTYYFANQSTGMTATTNVYWNFGDGTTSNSNNPTHTYTSAGTYRVCLYLEKDSTCVSDTCISLQVTVPNACNLVASFVAVQDTTNRYRFDFSNTSTPFDATDSVRYTFGDGTSSTNANPSHTYANAGTYNVCILVKKVTVPGTPPCVREFCRAIVIQATPAACNLRAAFSYRRDSVQTNKVYFNNLSAGLSNTTTSTWNFGDNTTATVNNPTHTYAATGAYRVCLRVQRDSLCFNDTCITLQVSVPNACNLVASFNAMQDTTNPLRFQFANTSTPVDATDSVRYTFGDGTSSTNANPSHTYTSAGTYNVCIRVKKVTVPGTVACVREFCQTIVVRQAPPPCNLQAAIVYNSDPVQTTNFHFFNQSGGTDSTTSVQWTFGDGTISNENNPTHTYDSTGAFMVCLRVQRDTLCFSETCMLVQVMAPPTPCNVTASFEFTRDSITPSTIHFLNTSNPFASSDSISWYFGDGGYSTDENPIHTFSDTGFYNVCIYVKKVDTSNGSYCVKMFCNGILIEAANNCQLSASFSSSIDSINSRKVLFSNTSAASAATTAYWTFGDGTVATGWNAAHTYAANGQYAVCLTIVNGNCTSTSCDSVIVAGNPVPPVNCNNARLEYVYRTDSYMPNKYYFFAISNSTLAQQSWTFRHISTGVVVADSQANPIHVFSDTGLYQVCLRATFSNGCSREFCNLIRVNSITLPAQCVLQAFPNPAHNQVGVNLQLTTATPIVASVYSAQNILMFTRTQPGVVGNNPLQFNISSLTPGFYVIRLMHGNSVCYARFQKF